MDSRSGSGSASVDAAAVPCVRPVPLALAGRVDRRDVVVAPAAGPPVRSPAGRGRAGACRPRGGCAPAPRRVAVDGLVGLVRELLVGERLARRAALSADGPAGPGEVLRAVLAGVGVLARVDRPERAGARAVPRPAVPLGIERQLGRLVVAGGARGRAARTMLAVGALATGPGAGSGPRVALAGRGAAVRGVGALRIGAGAGRRRAAPGSARRRRPAAPRPLGAPRIARRPCPVGVRAPRLLRPVARAAPGLRRRARRPEPPLAVDEPLVRRLDREEPGQGAFAGRVGVVLLDEPPVGGLDLVQGRGRRDPQRAVRVSLERHGTRLRVAPRGTPDRVV